MIKENQMAMLSDIGETHAAYGGVTLVSWSKHTVLIIPKSVQFTQKRFQTPVISK